MSAAGEDKIVPLRKRNPCPMCGKAVDARFRPFCSKRCADLDLGKWLGERYRVPGEKAPAPGPRGAGEDAGADQDADEETP